MGQMSLIPNHRPKAPSCEQCGRNRILEIEVVGVFGDNGIDNGEHLT